MQCHLAMVKHKQGVGQVASSCTKTPAGLALLQILCSPWMSGVGVKDGLGPVASVSCPGLQSPCDLHIPCSLIWLVRQMGGSIGAHRCTCEGLCNTLDAPVHTQVQMWIAPPTLTPPHCRSLWEAFLKWSGLPLNQEPPLESACCGHYGC
jgi:hypothetical protein